MGCSNDRTKRSLESELTWDCWFGGRGVLYEIEPTECTTLLNHLELHSSDCNFRENRDLWTVDDKLKRWPQFSDQNRVSGVHLRVVLKNFFISFLMNASVSNTNIFGWLFCYVNRHCSVPVLFGQALIKNTNEVTQHVAGVILHILEELIYVRSCGRWCRMAFQFKIQPVIKSRLIFAEALNKHC